MASFFGFAVDVVFWGFVLLTLFCIILFFDNLLSYRKYRLLREEFEFLKQKSEEEKAVTPQAMQEIAGKVDVIAGEVKKLEIPQGTDSGAMEEVLKAQGKLNKLSKKVDRVQKKATAAEKLAKNEPKKRVTKKVFRRTVKSIRKQIGETGRA